jgi:hypothetical protein
MTIEQHINEWWSDRSEEHRQTLTAAAAADRVDGATVRLLIETRCPVGPVGTTWESQPDFGWTWPNSVRTFIAG